MGQSIRSVPRDKQTTDQLKMSAFSLPSNRFVSVLIYSYIDHTIHEVYNNF